MGKKKVVKKEKETDVFAEEKEEVKGKLYNPIGNAELVERITRLEWRVDSIIEKHDSCKSLKGI